jgi:hypothetical protein
MFPNKVTWPQAQQICGMYGLYQPTIHSEALSTELNNQIVKVVKPYPGSYWIGGSDSAVEGTWAWADGNPWRYSR